MLDRRITPTSATRRSQWQHEFRRRCGALLCLGYALLAQQPPIYTEPIGRRSTYQRRNAVSSRPSTSLQADEGDASRLPSFLVAGQIAPDDLHLISSASLLVGLVGNMCLHHAVSCITSLRVPFRFSLSKLTH